MSNAFAPAIAALKADIDAMEEKIRETKNAVNTLCSHAGLPPEYVVSDHKTETLSSIRPDTFYGKTIGVAAREYLDMRKASSMGPTTPKEIYNALVEGGMQFDTKTAANAQISVSNTLRKNSKIFHRLPNGNYGLLTWYPGAKAEKTNTDTQTATDEKSAAENVSSAEPDIRQEDGSDEPPAQGRKADVPGGGP
ncbi:MAG: hypothetical protein AAGA09_07225 [Pseudomonadota bacterium]